MTIWMLVSVRPVRLLGSVFWTVTMTVAAKLIVCPLSKMNTRNALARFVELIRLIVILFYRKNAHLVALVTTMIATCPKRKQFWHFTRATLQHRQSSSNQMVSI